MSAYEEHIAQYAPHEQLGPLPKDWRDRVQSAYIDYRLNQVPHPEPYWCTATRADGEPCAAYRMHGTDLCSAHARQRREATR